MRTKSLLGEGRNSPCINTQKSASFVGSFVLSGQLRGLAVRIDKRNPEKAANIWHPVTVEPERLFDSFMQPNHTTDTIESGTERIAAMTEMLSLIENPHYVLIGGKRFSGYDYRLSSPALQSSAKGRNMLRCSQKSLKEQPAALNRCIPVWRTEGI